MIGNINILLHPIIFFVYLLLTVFLCVHCINLEIKEKKENMWSRYNNEILKNIDYNIKHYHINRTIVKSTLLGEIDSDLNLFEEGIEFDVLQAASPFGVKYQLINHTLYRQKDCLFPTRCVGIEHFLLKLVYLDNYEIIVNVRDYPQLPSFSNLKVPVYSFSKTQEFNDIIYPAWSFWCGGPAISLYPTGIGRWDKLRTSLISTAKTWIWAKKKSIGFFRGSRTSSERDELIYLSRESPDLIDAAYTKNQAWKSQEDTLNVEPAVEVSFEQHCQYKYLFNFRGVTASFRFKHLFLCKSLVFHVGDEWNEFFYPLLKPWVHFIPVESNYKKDDIRKLLHFFQEHDDIAKQIAETGYNLIREYLKLGKITWYWKSLLKRYINLLKFNPSLNSSLMKVGI